MTAHAVSNDAHSQNGGREGKKDAHEGCSGLAGAMAGYDEIVPNVCTPK